MKNKNFDVWLGIGLNILHYRKEQGLTQIELAEKCERSYHYPIPEKENPMPNSELRALDYHFKKMQEEQETMAKSETHAQKPMLKSYTTEEQIETEFDALASLFRVAAMCENHAQIARNLSDPMAEERYLEEATHALESAHLLFILTHK